MDWLTGNGIWVLVVIAAVWFMMRRGGLHGFGMGGHHHGRLRGGQAHDHHSDTVPPGAGDQIRAMGAALDPVSGNPVRTDRALTAVFDGRTYHFESEDTRRRFEAEPQKYAVAVPSRTERPRRRRGC